MLDTFGLLAQGGRAGWQSPLVHTEGEHTSRLVALELGGRFAAEHPGAPLVLRPAGRLEAGGADTSRRLVDPTRRGRTGPGKKLLFWYRG